MAFFSLTPTFTQGLVVGQLSILLLLAFILRYLFFDSKRPTATAVSSISVDADGDPNDAEKEETSPTKVHGLRVPMAGQKDSFLRDYPTDATRQESLEWFNFLIDGVGAAAVSL
jgi:maintenance of morphology protein 1